MVPSRDPTIQLVKTRSSVGLHFDHKSLHKGEGVFIFDKKTFLILMY